MTLKEKKEQKDENKDDTNHSMNLAIVGAIVGVGIGLLSNSKTSKKFMENINKSDVLRVAGRELKRTVQEIITEQTLNSIKKTATGYMSKSEGNHSIDKDDSSQYEEIKEDNKNLNESLKRIENKLNNLVDSKK